MSDEQRDDFHEYADVGPHPDGKRRWFQCQVPGCGLKMPAMRTPGQQFCVGKLGYEGVIERERENGLAIEGRLTMADVVCVHRGERWGEIPCGRCGERDRLVPVAMCSLHDFCTAGYVGRTDKQRINGKVPKSCLTCPDRKAP